MTQNPDDLDAYTLKVMREADPLASRPASDRSLSTEAALRYTRARAARSTHDTLRRTRAKRHRRTLGMGVALAGAAAVAVITVNVSGSRIPTADAAILTDARHALIAGQGQVLEIDADIVSGKAAGQSAKSWTVISAPHDERTISQQRGGVRVETATVDDHPEIYDVATNTIYEGSAQSPSVTTLGAVSWIAMLSARGVKIDRHATLDGLAAIEVTRTLGNAISIFWMQPGTYRPLQYLNNVPTVPGPPLIIRYRTWRTLGQDQTSARLVSLSAQHPSARVLRSQAEYADVADQIGRQS